MLTAIVIDDEKNSREALLKKLDTHCPAIRVVAECSGGADGIACITKYQPRVVFLDIEMPQMNGFTMLQQLEHKNFQLIFTTAYNQYAIEAIRFSAFDYLVKPIDTTELINAVKRIETDTAERHTNQKLAIMLDHLYRGKNTVTKIAVSTLEGIDFIALDDIVYLEAVGNYTNVHVVKAKPLLASKTLKDFEEILPASKFFRIHNASVVNVAFIQKFIKGDGGQILLHDATILDVARRRKEELLQLMSSFAARV